MILFLLSKFFLNFEGSIKKETKIQEYTFYFLIKSVLQKNILSNAVFLTLNVLLFLTFVQIWQPTLYNEISSSKEIAFFPIYFSGIILSQILAGYFYEKSWAIKQLLVGVNFIFLGLIYLLIYLEDIFTVNIIFFSILFATFFNIRYISLNTETLLLSSIDSKLKSTLLSFINTIAMVLSIIFIYFYMYLLESGYEVFIYLVIVTVIYNFIYTMKLSKK